MTTTSFAIADDRDRAVLGDLLAHAFGFPVADADTWFTRAGHDNVLVHRDGSGLVGGMILVSMGQFFGGGSVPMIGLAGVGVAPERRGTGVGAAMMVAALREMRRRGAAISTLFPSTVPFYQGAGYERAGVRFHFRIPAADLAHAGRGAHGGAHGGDRVEPRPVDPDPELAAVQRTFAARHHGSLDRGPYVWQRMVRPWRAEPRAFAVRRGDLLVGHVVVVHKMADGHDTVVQVVDASAADAGAARAIFAFLGGYRSLAGEIDWQLHVPGIFQALLPDRRPDVQLQDFWMLRVLDPTRALVTRGWSRAVRGTVELAYDDDVLPECSGRFTLRVDEGRATVTEGGSGAVRIGARGLGALFAGFTSCSELALRGLADGRAAAIETLDALFSGPMPTMNEMF